MPCVVQSIVWWTCVVPLLPCVVQCIAWWTCVVPLMPCVVQSIAWWICVESLMPCPGADPTQPKDPTSSWDELDDSHTKKITQPAKQGSAYILFCCWPSMLVFLSVSPCGSRLVLRSSLRVVLTTLATPTWFTTSPFLPPWSASLS